MPSDQRSESSPANQPVWHPAWVLLAVVIAWQALLYIAWPIALNDAPPMDVVENTVWGTERVIATYKNPQLASLLLELARVVTGGGIGWPAYVLSQIAIGLTWLFVFLLGRGELGASRALIGTLLLTACYYFGWQTPEFNQDIVQMPFWAGVSLSLWRATETRKLIWWIALGVFAAGTIYGKLSGGVVLLAATSWFLADRQARSTLATPGPWIALAICLALFAPLGLWLVDGGLSTIAEYAVRRGNTKFNAIAFLGILLAVLLPMVILLWASGMLDGPRTSRTAIASALGDRFTRYLAWMTFAPVILTALAVTVAATGTKLMWGVPMLSLAGLLLVALFGREPNAVSVRRVFIAALGLIFITSGGMAFTTRYGNDGRDIADRKNWPQAEIAQRMRAIWQAEVGRPLRIVASESTNWVSGLIALVPGDILKVFTGADYRRSPWITPQDIQREGVLVVWEDRGRAEPWELMRFTGKLEPRYETFALRHPGKVRDVRVAYIIVKPKPAAGSSLPAAQK